MIWMLLTWRYDHRSRNNNLSNCKLTPKTNEDMMSIWSSFVSPSYPSVLDISTILHRWWSTSRFEELRLGAPSIYSLQLKIITDFCLWSVNFFPPNSYSSFLYNMDINCYDFFHYVDTKLCPFSVYFGCL